MRSPVCYLAHPIDFQGSAVPNNVEYVRNNLVRVGFVVYSPAAAFEVPGGATPGPAIQRINRAALNQADALVALHPEAETIGVPMELQHAMQLGIPTLVISKAASRSWVLAGLPSWVMVRTYPGKGAEFESLYRQAMESQREPVRRSALLPVRLDQPDAQLPTQAYPDDAGFDLYTVGQHLIEPGEFVDVPCGCSVQLPDGMWGLLVGRSSTLRKHELMVNPGIIDTGYRGPLYAGVRNLGPEVFEVKHGMRLAQLIPLPNLAAGLVPTPVQRLDESARGQSGFGSSGE